MSGSKGQSKDLIEILILILGTSIMIMLLYSFSVRRISSITEDLGEYHFEIRNVLLTEGIFYSEITGTNRTLAHLIGDAVASRKEMIDYGKNLGMLNISNIVEFFLDKYLDNWHLDLGFKKLGKPLTPEKRIYTAEILIPLSNTEGEFHKIYLYWWL